MHARITKKRRVISLCMILVFLVFFAFDLVRIQIIKGEEYDLVSSSVSERSTPIRAARGEIVDCNGNRLIYNDQGYSIIFDAAYFPSASEQESRNQIILNLIRLFEKNDLPWEDNLPLVVDKNGNIAFKEDSEKEIAEMKSAQMLNLNDYATAQNCFDSLIERYKLEGYPIDQARKVASVCYEMKRIYFSIGSNYTFAYDVPNSVVSFIKENNDFYKGVDVEIVPVRKYMDGTLAPHILGRTGPIDADEYATLKEEGYSITDMIGKSGIESAMESYLKGSDGEATVYTDGDGNRITKTTVEPEQGNTVVLTIDAGLQKVTQNALRDTLEDYAGTVGNMVRSAGAAVVLSVKDAAVLSCATYPSYDISLYAEMVEELNEAKGAPLWNRALLSTYATGSTMKPSVAVAALEENVIDDQTTFYCSGDYVYLGQHFKCEQNHVTRWVNVVNAIDESCNTFFYETSQLLGIEKMNEYRTLFGLGSKTGCELGEATGVLDSPEYRASINQTWLPGYTVQSAIGQAGNLFTPIQLANYCATIANGGTRYKTHFVKAIKTADYSKTISETKPEIMAEIDISKKTLDTVKLGMFRVTDSGIVGSSFSTLPVQCGAKTGTSQEIRRIDGVSVKINNGFLMVFAPYENPEIAIACVGEGLTSGGYLAPAVAKIIEYYYGQSDTMSTIQTENTLIG